MRIKCEPIRAPSSVRESEIETGRREMFVLTDQEWKLKSPNVTPTWGKRVKEEYIYPDKRETSVYMDNIHSLKGLLQVYTQPHSDRVRLF